MLTGDAPPQLVDYSDKKFNLTATSACNILPCGVCWGAVAVRWGNDLLLRFCAWLPPLLLHIAVWVSMTVAVLDQIGAVVVVGQYAARHPRLEQLGQELGKGTDRLQQKIAARVERRIQRAYPAAARPGADHQLRKGDECIRPDLAVRGGGLPR